MGVPSTGLDNHIGRDVHVALKNTKGAPPGLVPGGATLEANIFANFSGRGRQGDSVVDSFIQGTDVVNSRLELTAPCSHSRFQFLDVGFEMLDLPVALGQLLACPFFYVREGGLGRRQGRSRSCRHGVSATPRGRSLRRR